MATIAVRPLPTGTEHVGAEARGVARTPARSRRLLDVTVLLLPLALVLAVTRPLGDPDLWWHLRAGELIVGQGLTDQDPWSFASSQPWLLHAWLSEVALHGAHRLGGMTGVVVLQSLVIGLFGLVVLLSCRRVAGPEVAAIVAVLTVAATRTGFGTRPQLISWVLLALACPYLRRCVAERRLPWLLLPLTWVWANMHGLWFTTLLLFGALVLGLALEEGLRGWRVTVRFCGIGLAAFAVAATTPNGTSVLLGPGRVAETARFIAEWEPPTLLHPGPASALLLVGIVVAGWARSTRSTPPSTMLFVAAATVFGLMYFRTVPVMAIAVAPLAAETLQRAVGLPLPRLRWERATVVPLALAALLTTAVLLPLAQRASVPDPAAASTGTTSAAVAEAARRLDALPGRARVLNEYEFGGWLLWAARDTSPAVDGRAEIYETQHLQQYVDALALRPGWEPFVTDLHVDAALLLEATPLTGALRDRGWEPLWERDGLVVLLPPRGRS